MTLTMYTFEDAEGQEAGTYQTTVYSDAEAYAKKWGYAIRANEFEYSDGYIVDDSHLPPKESVAVGGSRGGSQC